MHKRSHGGESSGSLGKKLLYGVAAFVVLLVIAYFVVTSGAFLRSVILPKVGKSLNGEITAGSASLSPFSKVDLQKVKVQAANAEPVLTADEVRVRYRLMKIMGGNIYVDEVTLINPVVQIIKEADGSSNLDPLLKKSEEQGREKPAKKKKNELRLQNFALQNGTVRLIEKAKDGSSRSTELKNLNINLDKLGNALNGNLKIDGDLALEQTQQKSNSVLQAKLAGSYAIALDRELLPDVIKGRIDLNVSRATGAYQDIAGLKATLNADVTPTEVRQLALDFVRNGQNLGQARIQGPLDLNRKEGHLKVELASLDKNILELATAGKGWSFGQSTISSTNQLDLSQGGEFIATAGTLNGRKLSLAQNGQSTPELDLNLDYHANLNLGEKSLMLQKLTLTGDYQNKPLLRASLDRQMNLTWGQSLQGFREAAFSLGLTNLNVADWRPLTPTNIGSGLINLQLGLVAQQDGKILNVDLSSSANNLSMAVGTNSVRDAEARLSVKGVLEQFTAANLNNFEFTLNHKNERVVQANGALRYDLKSKDMTGQTTADVVLPKALNLYPVAGAQASDGAIKMSASFTRANNQQKASGNITLENLAGGYNQYQFNQFQAAFEYNLEIAEHSLEIHRAAATFKQNYNSGGSLDITGKYDLEKKSGHFAFKTVDLNENIFRPILARSLGENQLVSIALNSAGDATYDPAGESAIKADIKVSNWVVKDKESKLPKSPLAVTVNVDGSMKKELIDLRQLLVQLSPTPRAGNTLTLKGNVDLSKTNAQPSTLTLSSEAFDVTPYYDLFAGGSTNQAKAEATRAGRTAATTTTTNAPGSASQGTAAANLPVQNLTANLKLDRFYLRDIAISNWTGTVAIQSNMVAIKPFKLQLNGAPVDITGNLNLAVPGYQYAFTLSGDHIPLAPLANSFSATNQAGKLKGDLIAQMNISGTGISGTNLQKSLQGNAYFSFTNMDYRVFGPKMSKIVVPIALVLRTPELTNTPISFVNARTDIGSGKVNLQELVVQSEAFLAQSHGIIELAEVLTNSPLNLPVDLSLRRSLAEKAKVLPPNTPADAKYAKLPSFVTVKGTVGDPKTDINKTELVKLGIETAVNFGVGGKDLGKVGEGLGILQGQGDTNKTATEKVESLIGGVSGLLSKKPTANPTNNAATNNPPAQSSTNQPAPKQKINALDLFKRFEKKE
jgi:hypothetical protein